MRVFAWTQQPTKKQASIAGISPDAQTVIKFKMNADFQPDYGNSSAFEKQFGFEPKSIEKIVVQTTDWKRIPITIKDIEIVGFQKEWWQFWKK